MKAKMITGMAAALFMFTTNAFAKEEPQMSIANAHQHSFTTIDGEKLPLSDYKNKVVLIVNTASHCGLTPQYEGLQKLYDDYKDKGLVVLGVPSRDFGKQEFEQASKVKEFTDKKFSVTFPMTTLNMVSGDDAHPFYQWAKQHAGFLGSPKWNFHKYLINKEGNFVTWFASTTSPQSKKVVNTIEAELVK